MPLIAMAVVLPAVAVALIAKLVGDVIFRRQPARKAAVDRYYLWLVLPLVGAYLLVVAWRAGLLLLAAAVLFAVVVRYGGIPYGTPRARKRHQP